MTQEDKLLVLKDLSTRLPYGVKALYYDYIEKKEVFGTIDVIYIDQDGDITDCDVGIGYWKLELSEIKPYLFPLSSITEEQYDEMEKIVSEDYLENIQITKEMREKVDFITHWPLYSPKVIDWFYKNHFDYKGLIPMGLALDAIGLNIY